MGVNVLPALLAALFVALAACGEGSQTTTAAGTGEASPATASAALSGELTVFAAASLTDAFAEIGEAFGEDHPDVEVVFSFGPSSGLSVQISEGAPADVFASAAPAQMDAVVEAELVEGDPVTFTGNFLEIAVEPGNPLGITALADLAEADVTLVLAGEDVPVGQYGDEALAAADVEVAPASREVDVRAVLTKVALGEADAGIVYRSDVFAAGDDVEGVEIPEDENVPATYPIAALRGAPNPEAAAAFVEFVLSEEGQDTLVEYGYAAP